MGHGILGREGGRKDGRAPHRPHLFAAAREEHRIRMGPDSAREARNIARNCDLRRGARRDRRQEALHGSDEGNSKVLIGNSAVTPRRR